MQVIDFQIRNLSFGKVIFIWMMSFLYISYWIVFSFRLFFLNKSLLRNKMECMMNFSPYCLRQEVARNIGSQITKVKMQLDNQCDQVSGTLGKPSVSCRLYNWFLFTWKIIIIIRSFEFVSKMLNELICFFSRFSSNRTIDDRLVKLTMLSSAWTHTELWIDASWNQRRPVQFLFGQHSESRLRVSIRFSNDFYN